MGKLFISRYLNLIVPCREPQIQYFPDGRERIIRPGLYAEFGFATGQEFTQEGYQTDYEAGLNPGAGFVGAEIRGGVFDLEQQAKAKGWTREETDFVGEYLTMLANDPNNPCKGDFEEWTPHQPTPPWPTYDELDYQSIPNFAKRAGLVVEALRYEQATKKRDRVINELEKKLAEIEQEQALVAT